MFGDLFGQIAERCAKLPDRGTDKMPTFAKAIRAAYARHGLTPTISAEQWLRNCEGRDRYSAALTVEAINAGIPEDEVMTLVYLIF